MQSTPETYQQCFRKLIEKSKLIIVKYKEVTSAKFDEELVEIMEKNILVLTNDLSMMQITCPLAFEGMIKEILEFSVEIRSCPPKCAMLMFNNNIHTYEYVTNPQTNGALMFSYEKLGIDPVKQEKCYNEFQSFFYNRETNIIENLLNRLLTYCMLLQEENIDDQAIDDDINELTTMRIDRINQNSDNSPRQIGLNIIDRLVQIMTIEVLPLIQKLVDNVITGGFDNVNSKIQDNIISILIGMPTTLLKTGIPNYKNVFNIVPVLKWINDNAGKSESRLSRRFPSLIHEWYKMIDPSLKMELFRILFTFLKHPDDATKYQTIRSISLFVQEANAHPLPSNPTAQVLEFGEILLSVAPIVEYFCQKLNHAEHIYPILQALSKIVLKSIESDYFNPQVHS